MKNNNSGIYQITNIITGSLYIGSSNNISRRLTGHKLQLAENKHDNGFLQAAYNKYGKEAFVFNPIHSCPPVKCILEFFEQHYIDKYWDNCKTCYNIERIANRPPLLYGHKHNVGFKHTNETKLKKSISMKRNGHIPPSWKGIKRGPVSDEWRVRQSEAHKNQKSIHRKLTDDDVRYIRANPNKLSCIKLAVKFSIAKCSILNIIHNKTYREII